MPSNIVDRNERVEKNLGLVHSCAHKFSARGVDYDDLFQAGCVGLIKAADGYDEGRGFQFSTYAVPVILGEIKRIFRDGGTVKVGRALKDKARFVSAQKEKLTKHLDRDPTMSELACAVGLDIAETAEALNAAAPVISLTCETNEEQSQLDIATEPPDEEISTSIALEQVIHGLGELDREIIKLRYYHSMTQTQVAKILGISQVQVSRKEKTILKIMRTNFNT